MITIQSNLVTDYAEFVAGSFQALLPIVGMTAGLFLAFAIFDRVVVSIRKATK